jgi:hypothetical protein
MLELEKFKIISICNWILDNEFFDENWIIKYKNFN